MSEAALACALLALDPEGLKGAIVKGPADGFLASLRHLSQRKTHRIPPHIGMDRLTGSIDVAATLKSGAPVHDRGLLAESDGFLLLTSAERLSPDKAALIAAAMDHGAAFTVIAHDEGIDDERAPLILAERVAFLLDVSRFEPLDIDIAAARALLPRVEIADAITEGLCQTALAWGLSSIRPAVMALRAARAAAALDGRVQVDEDDARLAASLILAPRAVTYPAPPEEEPDQPAPQDAPDPGEEDGSPIPQELADRLLEAVKASLPPTRSLQRAKKSLADLPGGGGTPLAAGIEQSMLVADQVRRSGGIPLVVFLTDGKANIARDGTADRAVALRDAEAAAKALRLAGFRTLMIDLSDTRTGPAAKLAEAMGADYLPLPHADASRISASVNAAMKAGA